MAKKVEQKILRPTTFEELKEYAKGQLVEIPAFAEGQPFVARLKRPSMLKLAETGRIPNSLLVTANQLFEKGGGGFNSENETAMSDMMKVIEEICSAAFVEPTYEEIKEAGIDLTDDQLMFIFEYTQVGVKSLTPFHKE